MEFWGGGAGGGVVSDMMGVRTGGTEKRTGMKRWFSVLGL